MRALILGACSSRSSVSAFWITYLILRTSKNVLNGKTVIEFCHQSLKILSILRLSRAINVCIYFIQCGCFASIVSSDGFTTNIGKSNYEKLLELRIISRFVSWISLRTSYSCRDSRSDRKIKLFLTVYIIVLILLIPGGSLWWSSKSISLKYFNLTFIVNFDLFPLAEDLILSPKIEYHSKLPNWLPSFSEFVKIEDFLHKTRNSNSKKVSKILMKVRPLQSSWPYYCNCQEFCFSIMFMKVNRLTSMDIIAVVVYN